MTKVEDLTGFPECLDGRVKTLHPKVHAGILADRRLETTCSSSPISASSRSTWSSSTSTRSPQTVASGATPDECVEQIDIGGPSMVRAAAKNHPSVAVVTSPVAYADVLAAVEAGRLHPRAAAAARAEAFAHTATYDVAVASWMGIVLDAAGGRPGFPAWIGGDLGARGGAAVRREPAPAGGAVRQRLATAPDSRRPSSCTARR